MTIEAIPDAFGPSACRYRHRYDSRYYYCGTKKSLARVLRNGLVLQSDCRQCEIDQKKPSPRELQFQRKKELEAIKTQEQTKRRQQRQSRGSGAIDFYDPHCVSIDTSRYGNE